MRSFSQFGDIIFGLSCFPETSLDNSANPALRPLLPRRDIRFIG
jgi:hypothetical protein